MKHIAVSCEMEFVGKPQMTRALCNMDYIDYVKAAGASPFVVCPGMDVTAIAEAMDGLLLTGGKDISPLLYGEDLDKQGASNCNLIRDVFEKKLYFAFLRKGKPVYGICRGFQLIGIFNGLSFIQEINTYKDISRCHNQGSQEITGDNPVHKMTSWGMMGLLCGKALAINSFHHQGFFMKGKTKKGDWVRSNDNVLGWSRSNDEAKVLEGLLLYLPSIPNGEQDTLIGGVQYHPERMLRGDRDTNEHLAPFQFVMGLLDDEWYEDLGKMEEDEQLIEQIEHGTKV